MAKTRTQYQCAECGAAFPKWTGQCPDCKGWNTLSEVTVAGQVNQLLAGIIDRPAPVRCLADVAGQEQPRWSTGSVELDRSMGGGVVAGSVTLLGGDPGIGKSTLLMQAVAALTRKVTPGVLYVSAEESIEQLAIRAKRLNLDLTQFQVLADNQLERIFTVIAGQPPRILVIDSIQTVFTDALSAAPGSVSQVRECAGQFVRFAKQTDTAVFLAGHVTKEGAIAGPRVLEHMVDTVLYFEGDRDSRHRVIRSVKNRFGAVNEIGVFAMTEKGLREINNPSAIFLTRHDKQATGSVVLVTREGTRPLLVEVQALVDTTPLSNPRRLIVGSEQNRLAMLLAVLHRHGGIATFDQDIYVNVVGGIRITETAADLAILLAVLSSLKNMPLADDLVVFGEVGLSGEIRPVQDGQARLQEAAKHGFKKALIPAGNAPKEDLRSVQVTTVATLAQVLDAGLF